MPRTLSAAEKLEWLMLCRSGGVGPRTFFKLLQRYGSARRAWQELPRLAREAGSEERWRRFRQNEAEAELDAVRDVGAVLLACGEATYPGRLAEIADPPPLITVLGQVEALADPGIAIVGARNASANGRLLAKGLAGELASSGLMVISGLARGIDTAAHEGALAAKGTTVAVIASGIDVPYPADNADLMARIAQTGAVVTERPIGSEPQARHFPRRNRMIAGLSLGVVVVEAAPGSGSLITARLAAEQGREVMAVPGSPLDPRHRGTNQLLRDGATLVETAADVRSALGPLAPRARPVRGSPAAIASERTPASSEPIERINPSRPNATASHPRAPASASRPGPLTAGSRSARSSACDTTDLALRIHEHLGAEPLLVDELIRQCHASPAEVQQALLDLELAGRLQRHPGNRVALAAG